MAYTKEFEGWLKEAIKHEDVLTWHEATHFWLSAFARLVDKDALMMCHAEHHQHTMNVACAYSKGATFTAICERFGLDPSGPQHSEQKEGG